MSIYNTQVPPPALFPGYPQNQATLWNNEPAQTVTYSQQVALPAGGIPGLNDAKPLSVELTFSADPGAFEVDVLTSDTDSLDNYHALSSGGSISAATKGPNGSFTARLEIPSGVRANFALLSNKTPAANNVNVTAKVAV